MSDVVKDSDVEYMKSKSNADLQTIIDNYSSAPSNPFRQAAMKVMDARIKKRSGRAELVQIFILIVGILAFIVMLVEMLKKP